MSFFAVELLADSPQKALGNEPVSETTCAADAKDELVCAGKYASDRQQVWAGTTVRSYLSRVEF
jgi:hypothetical protein